MALLLAVLAASAQASAAASPITPEIGGPVNLCDYLDPPPPPPPPPCADGAQVDPELYLPVPVSQVTLEPTYSHGDAYWPHGTVNSDEFYEPWPEPLVARADTEAKPRAGVTTTIVMVMVQLEWFNLLHWRWEVIGQVVRWSWERCQVEGDYDVDGYAGGPWLGPGLYRTRASHWVWRDGLLTASASHVTPPVIMCKIA
jgi:hypothetical protein